MVSFHCQTIEIKIKATVAVSRRLGLTREEKSLRHVTSRHVALVAKFLDDNKPKIHKKENFYVASNSIDLI